MPKSRQVCLLASDSYDKILDCLKKAKIHLSDSLSAIEFMDYPSVAFSLDYFKIENPFREKIYKYYLLIEGSANSSDELLNEKMLEMLDEISESYEDAILCDNESQVEKIWKIREGISMATAANGMTIKFDVSVQSQNFAELIDETQSLIGDKALMIGHGHIGDGNLHLNCTIKGF
jgi:FAD/FMN-containing dehydrogenase